MLNEKQLEAVEHTDGPLLVLAGAGSGKTRVVTQRICRLIEKGVSPAQILGLTFTNKAAGEMRERVRAASQSDVLISTFHSLCVRILRESIHVLGYENNFSIYDEEESLKALKAAIEDLAVTLPAADLKALRAKISRAKNALEYPRDVENPSAHRLLDRALAVAYDAYMKRLKQYNALDFDDLLFLTVELFEKNPDILERYQERWHYLLIDEYQDTNAAQYQLTRLLVGKRQNICVVGDPDQSIYSWRGANIYNILDFENDFSNVKVVRLEQNYRSTNTILSAANHLIQQNRDRLDKDLWSELGEGEKISLHTALDEKYETFFVIDTIRQHLQEGISLKDMVVFYRTNSQSRPFEDKLLSNNIPYTIVGGLSFYQRREIKDVLAYLKVIASGSDFISFERTINLPKRGIGAATIDKLRAGSFETNMPIIDYCRDLLAGEQTNIKLTPKAKKALAGYIELISSFRRRLESEKLSDLLRELIHDSGYFQMLTLDEETFEDRKENLLEMINKANEWESEHPDKTLESFLEELTLKANVDELDDKQDKLNLMTLHNGKGLEYRVTFICGLEEDLLPHVNSKNSETALEEERRLCYVGMTRAKERLYLTHAMSRYQFGQSRIQRASRFLKEIPYKFITKVR